MKSLSNTGKVVIVAIVAAIFIILLIVYGSGNGGNGAGATTSDNATGSNGAVVTAGSPTQTTGGVTVTQNTANAGANGADKNTDTKTVVAVVKSPAAPVIHMITPVDNDVWKIATPDLISWSKAGGISGSLSLIDATTGQSVGVILPQVGPNQTSFTWNTRDLLLDRTNPLGKTVLPGTYEIRLAYDGNGIQPITSPSFTITN